MTYVVTENCIRCKYTDCVEVCPVDCFYEGETMLVINPDECIDCGVCEPECPAEAIKPDSQGDLQRWLALNAEYAKVWPNISARQGSARRRRDVGRRRRQVREVLQDDRRRVSVANFSALGEVRRSAICPTAYSLSVMAGLDPAIHLLAEQDGCAGQAHERPARSVLD